MERYVVYYRVSTNHQEKSGLGLNAQKTAVENFLKQTGATEIPPSFTEIESGKKIDRPELMKAIKRCKQTHSILLIAKLDRLARNVAFIFQLHDDLKGAGVDFKALDLPEANTLTLGILASFAQHEAERISQRTKAGLAEAKKKGIKLGNPNNLTNEARRKGSEKIMQNAITDKRIRHAFHFIKPLREQGLSYQKIANKLNEEGYETRKGKDFNAIQVQRIYNRLKN